MKSSFLIGGAIITAAGLVGYFTAPAFDDAAVRSNLVIPHGLQSKDFFDNAYDRIEVNTKLNAIAGLSAHHLIIPDQIAEVFETLRTKKPVTLVLVSPNHFSIGLSAAQTTSATWTTPYGEVETDDAAVTKLVSTVPFLRSETLAFPYEHGIAALTPFIARSLPNTRIVPIILDESLSASEAWTLGEAIARELPNVLLIASIDMTHYRETEYTAENDAKVMALLDDAMTCAFDHCDFDFDIDSNSSLRTLLGFVHGRGGGIWHMTHHGSSLNMGATSKPEENTSHILGYFLRSDIE